jgi:hypothetical protein
MVMGACVSHPEKISKTKKVDDDDKIQVIAAISYFFASVRVSAIRRRAGR